MLIHTSNTFLWLVLPVAAAARPEVNNSFLLGHARCLKERPSFLGQLPQNHGNSYWFAMAIIGGKEGRQGIQSKKCLSFMSLDRIRQHITKGRTFVCDGETAWTKTVFGETKGFPSGSLLPAPFAQPQFLTCKTGSRHLIRENEGQRAPRCIESSQKWFPSPIFCYLYKKCFRMDRWWVMIPSQCRRKVRLVKQQDATLSSGDPVLITKPSKFIYKLGVLGAS